MRKYVLYTEIKQRTGINVSDAVRKQRCKELGHRHLEIISSLKMESVRGGKDRKYSKKFGVKQ